MLSGISQPLLLLFHSPPSLFPKPILPLTAPAICRTEGSLWSVGVAGVLMWSVAQYVYYGFRSNLRSDVSVWKNHTQDGDALQSDENSSRSSGFTLLFRQAWKKAFKIQAALISQCLKCLTWHQNNLFFLIIKKHLNGVCVPSLVLVWTDHRNHDFKDQVVHFICYFK